MIPARHKAGVAPKDTGKTTHADQSAKLFNSSLIPTAKDDLGRSGQVAWLVSRLAEFQVSPVFTEDFEQPLLDRLGTCPGTPLDDLRWEAGSLQNIGQLRRPFKDSRRGSRRTPGGIILRAMSSSTEASRT